MVTSLNYQLLSHQHSHYLATWYPATPSQQTINLMRKLEISHQTSRLPHSHPSLPAWTSPYLEEYSTGPHKVWLKYVKWWILVRDDLVLEKQHTKTFVIKVKTQWAGSERWRQQPPEEIVESVHCGPEWTLEEFGASHDINSDVTSRILDTFSTTDWERSCLLSPVSWRWFKMRSISRQWLVMTSCYLLNTSQIS